MLYTRVLARISCILYAMHQLMSVVLLFFPFPPAAVMQVSCACAFFAPISVALETYHSITV